MPSQRRPGPPKQQEPRCMPQAASKRARATMHITTPPPCSAPLVDRALRVRVCVATLHSVSDFPDHSQGPHCRDRARFSLAAAQPQSGDWRAHHSRAPEMAFAAPFAAQLVGCVKITGFEAGARHGLARGTPRSPSASWSVLLRGFRRGFLRGSHAASSLALRRSDGAALNHDRLFGAPSLAQRCVRIGCSVRCGVSGRGPLDSVTHCGRILSRMRRRRGGARRQRSPAGETHVVQ